MAEECAPCNKCGWDVIVPHCPVEYNDTMDAQWKEWRPRIEKDGKSYQEELVIVNGSRREFMQRLKLVFEKCDAHDFTAEWNAHIRNYIYLSFVSMK